MAVDAMGGDSAPLAPVEGAYLALKNDPGLYIVLIGNSRRLEPIINNFDFPENRFEIIHASQVIGMEEPPVAAFRRKKDASISVAMTLHRMGKVDAVVSAGNTGAQIVASMTGLGRIDGVLRPVIGSLIPTRNTPAFLLDVGANTDCGGFHLFQFGVMGSIFLEKVHDISAPRVGMLSIGSEKTKGNEVSLFAHHLLSESHLNFIGNVEGSDILDGNVDVAVCDGFVGNLLLKFAESFPAYLVKKIADEEKTEECENLKTFLYRNFNPELYGGVPILGVKGVSIVCHGSSTPKAIAAAVSSAADMVDKGINQEIEASLAELHRYYELNKYFLNIRKRWQNRKNRSGWNTNRFLSWFSPKNDDESGQH